MMNLPEHIRMPFSSQFPVSLGNVSLRTLPVYSKHLELCIEVSAKKGKKLLRWSQSAPHSSSCLHSICLVAFGLPVPPWRQPQGHQWPRAPPTPPSLFTSRLPDHLQVLPNCKVDKLNVETRGKTLCLIPANPSFWSKAVVCRQISSKSAARGLSCQLSEMPRTSPILSPLLTPHKSYFLNTIILPDSPPNYRHRYLLKHFPSTPPLQPLSSRRQRLSSPPAPCSAQSPCQIEQHLSSPPLPCSFPCPCPVVRDHR